MTLSHKVLYHLSQFSEWAILPILIYPNLFLLPRKFHVFILYLSLLRFFSLFQLVFINVSWIFWEHIYIKKSQNSSLSIYFAI